MREKAKIEALYHTHRELMYDVAYSVLNDPLLAEDAVSESFMRIIKNFDKIDLEDPVRSRNLLAIVCRNVSIDIYNKRKREVLSCYDSDFVNMETPEDLVIDTESMQRVMGILHTMKPIYKDTLFLRRAYNMSRTDIANLLEISVETVTKRLQRAKAEIKKQLSAEEVQ